MKRIIAITLTSSALLTACSTAKKGTDTGTAEVTTPKENQMRIEKVTPAPAATQTQKAEILYDK